MLSGASQGVRALVRRMLVVATVALVVVGYSGAADSASRAHKVVKGESLTSVAKKYGTSVSRLATANDLKPSAGLRIGQILHIPGRTAAPAQGAVLPSSVRHSVASAKVKKGRWQNIVLHHSGTAEATVKGMDHYHRRVRRMENGLAYHFVIGNGHGMKDGEIHVGSRWTRQLDGGHLRSLAQNKVSLGICLVGNYDQAPPTAAQMRSLKLLLAQLQSRCGLDDDAVVLHREVNVVGTACPGKKFPASALRKDLAALSP